MSLLDILMIIVLVLLSSLLIYLLIRLNKDINTIEQWVDEKNDTKEK